MKTSVAGRLGALGRLACLATGLLSATSVWAQVPGDSDCDGSVTEADLAPIITRLFDPSAPACDGVDANRDGTVTAADLTAVARIVAPPPDGPLLSYFGTANAEGTASSPSLYDGGRPVFVRRVGSGFLIVVEARTGASGYPPGLLTYNPGPKDPSKRPDLQIESNRPLGDGSSGMCQGGVPGIDPPDFSVGQSISDALNDFGCNFTLSSLGSCTQNEFGQPAFLGAGTQAQYCLLVSRNLLFGNGDTTLTLRMRDTAGNLGPAAQIVLRIGEAPASTPTPTRTLSPSRTPTRSLPTSTPTRTPTLQQGTPTSTRTSTATVAAPSRTPTFSTPPTSTRTATHAAGTPSATATARTATPTQTATVFPTQTVRSPSPSGSPTRTPTRTATSGAATATPTRTPPSSATATPVAPTPTRTASASRTPTQPAATFTATAKAPTATFTRTATPTLSGTPTRTSTVTQVPSATFTLTATRTRTPTPTTTPARTATPTRTLTRTPTPTATATATPAGVIGPIITYFGLTRADDSLIAPSGTNPQGLPIYTRVAGAGFSLVIEGKKGRSGEEVGRYSYDPSLSGMPDLQIVVSRPLGDGSTAVCDNTPPNAGGVPAVDPPVFGSQEIGAVNDLACRFLDGGGQPMARGRNDSCVQYADGSFDFAGQDSTLQFCGFVDAIFHFPPGDTIVTARLRDALGNPGEPAQIVVRIGS